MLSTLAVTLILSLLPLSTHAGMMSQPVENLDAKTFKTAMESEHAAMVAFVAPWCGHCKNLAPEYTAAARSLSPLIPFYSVDCDAAPNKPLCAEYQVKGFPTIKAFPRAGKGAARDYNGERKRGALVEFAKGLVPDRVKKLRVDDGVEGVLKKFLTEQPDLAHALLIHPSTPSIPFLWKVLGHRLSGKMQLGYIRDSTPHSVLSSLGIYDSKDTSRETTRALVWRAGEQDQGSIVEYDGVMKFNAMLAWLQSQLAVPAASPKAAEQKPLQAPEPERGEQTEEINPSPVEDAPDAVPAEGVSAKLPVVPESEAAEPEPEAEAEPMETGQEAEETARSHEEL